MTRTEEAAALQAEWKAANAEHRRLADEGKALTRASNLPIVRAYNERLRKHSERLHALMLAMEAFHATHGPIGGVVDDRFFKDRR